MSHSDNRPQPVLSYGTAERTPMSPWKRMGLLVVFTIGGFVLWFALLIAALDHRIFWPARAGAILVVVAPLVYLFLFIVVRSWRSLVGQYQEIKAIADPRARRRRILGSFASSLVIAGLAGGRFYLRALADRAAERRTTQTQTPVKPQASWISVPASAPGSFDAAESRRVTESLLKAINSGQIVLPTTIPTARKRSTDQ